LVQAIDPMVRRYEPPILNQAVHSLALFGWCRLQPNIAPSEQFVMKLGDYEWMVEGQRRELNPEEEAWRVALERYGFERADELDRILAQGVADGFFDPGAVKAAAEQKNALLVSEKAGNSVTEAWSAFHHSFGGTEESVSTAIFESVKQHAEFVTPMNLDGSVRMIKELGYPQMAADLIAHYIKVHSGNPKMFDLDDYAFAGEMRDPDVIAAFKVKANSVPDTRDPLDVLVHISKHGASRADRSILEALTVEELAAIFKRAGSKTRRVIKAAFELAPSKPDESDPLRLRAKSALISIGRESLLNRIRVKRFGITDSELAVGQTSTVE
jgi:lambda repressor-like predicted transcriptional regulator